MSKVEDVLSKLVQLNRFKKGGLGVQPPAFGGYEGLGAKPPAARQFWEKSYFNAIGSEFTRA